MPTTPGQFQKFLGDSTMLFLAGGCAYVAIDTFNVYSASYSFFWLGVAGMLGSFVIVPADIEFKAD